MKSSLHINKAARALALAGLGALLGCGLLAPDAQAQRRSPVGNTWDCLLSGNSQQGIAYLTFYTNGTFDGIRILAGKARGSTSLSISSDGRSVSGLPEQRSPIASAITSSAPLTNLFGFDSISGPWGYDERGRLIGNFVEYVGQATTTYTTNENITPLQVPVIGSITNADDTVIYYTNLTTIYITNEPTVTVKTSFELTNHISFVGSVVPHRRLTLVSSTPGGRVSYSGVPVNTHLSNLSGDWYATRSEFNQSFIEFFTLYPDSTIPNLYYTTNGAGPGYTTTGICLLSSRRKVGFSFHTFWGGDTNYNLSASYGSFSSSSSLTRADTRGFEMQTDEPTTIRFRAVRLK